MCSSPDRKTRFYLLSSLLILVLAAVSCNLPAGLQERFFGSDTTVTPTPAPTFTPQPLPPTIVETDPPLGSDLQLGGTIRFYFNQAMDQASVESALAVSPGLEGSMSWEDDATLVYSPARDLPPDQRYVFSLGTSAAAANGLTLTSPAEMVFFTPDWLRPSTLLPLPESVEIDPTSAVVVSFNQPVVPLGDVSEGFAPGFSLLPQVPGRGEWINTSTYQFTPEGGMAGGVSYQVELNADLVSTAGAALDPEAVRSWSFTTSYPEILSWEPGAGAAGIPLDASLILVFNQPMDTGNVADNFSLMDSRGQGIRGTWEWSDDLLEATFTPDGLLERAQNYSVMVPGETLSAGRTPLRIDTAWAFQTTGDFAFLGTPKGQNYTPSVYEGATLYFNNPVDLESVLDNIAILPEVTNLRPSAGGSGNVLSLYGDFEPLHTYTLVMKEGLADIWGSQLGAARSLTFTTEALPPNLVISQGLSVLFLTGSETAIPAQATNLYQVAVNIGRIPPQDYAQFFGAGYYLSLENYYPADLVYFNQIFNIPGDDSYTINLPLNQAGTSLAPGLYRYQVFSSELPYNPSPYLLAVSNVHLAMKTSPNNILVWALDLKSGKPLSNTEITIYHDIGKEFTTGTTDQNGIFQADFSRPWDLYDKGFYAITGEPGTDSFGITGSNWGFGAEPYNFGLRSDYGVPRPQTYIYTDRPIYRPGQTVYFRLVHRLREEGAYALPDGNEITVTLFKEGGGSEEAILPISDFGTAHGEFQLSDYDRPGYYRLETEYGMVFFQVAEYRKPEIDLALTLGPAESMPGEEWQGDLDARYYFDAPASEIDISWSLRAVKTSFYLPGYRVGRLDSNWFVFSDYPFGRWSSIASGEGQTDTEGTWSMQEQVASIDRYDNEIVLPANYILSVTAEDETGFQVSAESEMLVHPSDFYIGVKPSAWISEQDTPVDFEILAVDWEKQPDGVHSLKAELNRVTWNYEVGEFGQMEYFKVTEKISERSFSTDQQGKASFQFIPPTPGTYEIDVFGGGARTEVTLWVGGAGTTVWPTQSNQKINLVADRDSYQPGDEAVIFIPNPFPRGAQALVTIERHKILDAQVISITGSGYTIRVPLGEELAPNVYVSVILIGEDPVAGVDFRQGYINLLVDPGSHLLNIEVVGKPEKLGPGEEVEFDLKVTDQNGEPVVGEISLAVVDQAIFALADPNSQEINEAFYGIQPVAVRLGIPLGVHAGRNLFFAGGIGGGGGEAVFTAREQFEDTAFWQADIVTDENGEARVGFRLPDNLTTWQVDALGVTAETDVGHSTTEVITTKDLLIRPVTPRFLVAGDHLALAAVVHNNTEADLSGEVSLQASGIQLDLPDFSTQSVEIPAGSRIRVEWWGTVEDVDQADLLFAVDAGSLQDAVKPYQGTLPVYRYTVPVSYGTSGILTGADNRLEIVTLPRSYDAKAGSLDVELSPSLAAVLLTALEAIEDDSRFTSDAVMAYFLPNVITYATLQELDLDYALLESRLSEIIPETLGALESSQNEDGGWGWWQGGASDPVISSYILFGLVKAQESGVFVDDTMIQNARGYLLATLPAVDMLAESWQYNQLAFRYFALSEAGIDVSSGMLSLAQLSSQLSPANQALLAVALESQIPGNAQTRTLLSNLAGTAIRSATGAHWDTPESCQCWFTNSLTTTAMVNYAFARLDGAAGILPESVRYLVSSLEPDGSWGSPTATSWSILALNEILKVSGDLEANYSYSAAVNGTELITGQAQGITGIEAAAASLPVDRLYQDDPNALNISRTEGEGRLYYKAYLQVFRQPDEIEPFGKGLSISRVYTGLTAGDEFSFTQSGKMGDLIQVRLTVVVEDDLHYLMVEDKIPAGSEVLDTRLNTTRQDLPEFTAGSPFKQGWGWWYFNRPVVYDNRVIWAADYVPAGTYQLVYTISLTHPGEYQVLPARVWQLYFPETQAISAGEKFVVEAVDQ